VALVTLVYVKDAHWNVVLEALHVERDVLIAPFIVLNDSLLSHIVLPAETLQVAQQKATLIIITSKKIF
jgi:hypothetical protein